jgi:hypothetical protein
LVETLTIPLVNLQLERSDIIDLGASKIIPISRVSDPIRSMARLGIETDTYPPALPVDYVLQTQSEQKVDDAQAEVFLNRALTVFKLFKDSLVFSNVIVIGDPPERAYGLRHYKPWSRVPIERYSLADNETKQFVEFWKRFIGVNPGSFPVYRFHLADFRPYLRDRVVDYVDSLEYLFVPDSGEGEISYKFRSRGTLLIGHDKNSESKGRIYEALKRAYTLRSAIVHGNADKEDQLLKDSTWEDEIAPIRCYDREAIKFFFIAGCIDDSEKRRTLLEKRLIFDAEMSWKTPEDFARS